MLKLPLPVGYASVVQLDVADGHTVPGADAEASTTMAVLGVSFGVPLHDAALNAAVCETFASEAWASADSLRRHSDAMHRLEVAVMRFAATFVAPCDGGAAASSAAGAGGGEGGSEGHAPRPQLRKDLLMAMRAGWAPYPLHPVVFDGASARGWPCS